MIRLLGALIVVTIVVIAACSNGNSGNDGDGDGCKDIASSLTTGADGIPAVQGEVVTTASCLQIIDVQVGEGDAVQPGGIVSVDYTGYLEDGTVFDSSFVRGQPIAFSLNRVMQGWEEGIPGMRVGGMRRLIVPAELATGTFGFGPSVPPNETLIFDIELLELFR